MSTTAPCASSAGGKLDQLLLAQRRGANWPNATLSSLGPNGNNWFGWGFPNNAVIGITRRANELWLGWTASNGKGSSGGFNFPHPHVQIVKVDTGS